MPRCIKKDFTWRFITKSCMGINRAWQGSWTKAFIKKYDINHKIVQVPRQ